MADVTARVDLKCRVSGIDPVRPRKETYQHFEVIEFKTPVIDEDEWELRKMIAAWILMYGFDFFF